MLPAQDKELLLRRLTNLLGLGLISDPQVLWSLGVDEARIREAISRDEESAVSERYLLHKESYYENETDEQSVEMCSTLEEVEAEVVEYLTQEAGRGYGFFVHVYDLDEGKKLDYDLVHSVKWKLE